MTRQLLLIRHAKSNWDDFSIADFDRPLNDRGKRDAPMMAHRLLDRKISIDAFLASPAKRAKRTAEYFTKTYARDKAEILFLEELYLAAPAIFFDVIAKTDDRFQTIALFSHNDGITQFANRLTDVQIDDIPTCGIFAVKANTHHWSGFADAEKDFWFFDSPKQSG